MKPSLVLDATDDMKQELRILRDLLGWQDEAGVSTIVEFEDAQVRLQERISPDMAEMFEDRIT